MSFYVLILKKHVLTVHMTVTLRMMSNSRKSSPVINAHLPIDNQAEVTVPIAESLKKWQQSSSQ
jgi:hypothetical protein